MWTMKCDHIKRITLTSDNIKRLSLYVEIVVGILKELFTIPTSNNLTKVGAFERPKSSRKLNPENR
jgi:hypothetical protein